MKNAIITGPTGMIGVALTEYLLEQGIDVYAIVRPNSRNSYRLKENDHLHIVFGSLNELDALSIPVLDDAVFFHLGWEGADKTKRDDIELQLNNIKWTISAVKFASKIRCNSFVFAGSQAQYGRVEGVISEKTPCNPEVAYGMAKLCAEGMSRLMCEETGIKHCSARIFSVYGKYDGDNTLVSYLIRELKDGRSPSLTACEQNWNYLYAKDAAKALFLIAQYGENNAVYNVASNDVRPLKRFVEELQEMVNPLVEVEFGVKPYAKNQVMNLSVSLDALMKLGFSSSFSFKQGLSEIIA